MTFPFRNAMTMLGVLYTVYCNHHSPFVLNSIPNAVAYDLEKSLRLENLTEYSYEALTEGYFKVETDSSFLLNKLTLI